MQTIKNGHVSTEAQNELLDVLGDLFELNIPVPIQILELDVKEIEHKKSGNFIARINEKRLSYIDDYDRLIKSAKEEFNHAFGSLDQFQKHDLFLNLCLQVINQKQKFPICIAAKEFYDHIEVLFTEKDRPNIKKIIENFIEEESIIRDIAQIKSGPIRRKKIEEHFSENRCKGARERLDEIMIVNALYEN